jgi:hypothetical protein
VFQKNRFDPWLWIIVAPFRLLQRRFPKCSHSPPHPQAESASKLPALAAEGKPARISETTFGAAQS